MLLKNECKARILLVARTACLVYETTKTPWGIVFVLEYCKTTQGCHSHVTLNCCRVAIGEKSCVLKVLLNIKPAVFLFVGHYFRAVS